VSDHETLANHLADLLYGIAPDVMEDLVHTIEDGHLDLGSITSDNLLSVLIDVLEIVGGVAAREAVRQNAPALRAAFARALGGPSVNVPGAST
jgi:hypothetical protein